MSYVILLFLCFSFFLAPNLANASTYYVAKDGSDGVSCAQAKSLLTPKSTITAGIACLSGSDVLNVRGGIYDEYIQGGIPSGSEGADTVVTAYQDEVVTIRPTIGTVTNDAIWFKSDQHHITLHGLIIDGSRAQLEGMRFTERVHHIRIVNSEVKNFHSNCIGVTGTDDYKVHHLTFSNVKLHDCGSTHQHHGIYIRGTDHVVEHSEIYNISGFGIHIYKGTSGYNDRHIIRNNLIHDNGGRGILLGSGDNNVAYNNIVWSNGKNGIELAEGTPQNNQIYNNTVYNNKGYCIFVRSHSTNGIVRNNICWQNGLNRVLDEGSGTVISHNLTTDPKFANPLALNFRITQGSPAVDGGTPVTIVAKDFFGTKRPQGLKYDIGAHEWASSQDTTPPKAPVSLRVK